MTRRLLLPGEASFFGPLDRPSLDPEERLRVEEMRRHLLTRIRQSPTGSLTFARFMEEILYAPGLGYYASTRDIFGPAGDYTTASHEADAYAALFAHKVGRLLTAGLPPEVAEVGPGSGRFAADFIRELAERGHRLKAYYLLEPHDEGAAAQRRLLGAGGPYRWARRLPPGFRGLILAHEVFDAQPCERFLLTAAGPQALELVANGDTLALVPCEAGSSLRQELDELHTDLTDPLPVPYLSEAAMEYERVFDLLTGADEALFLVVDYGYPRRSYYHPERRTGTLRCHYRHRVYDDPLWAPGVADVTAHVEFTRLALHAVEAGWTVEGFTSLASYALSEGSLEAVDTSGPRRRALARLIDPAVMGEVFKVLVLARSDSFPLPELGEADRSATL